MIVTTEHAVDGFHIEVTSSVILGCPPTRTHDGDDDEVRIRRVVVDEAVVDGAAHLLAIALVGRDEIEEAAVEMAQGKIKRAI